MKKQTKRNQKIAVLRSQGKTMIEIGSIFGISSQRVRSILVSTLGEGNVRVNVANGLTREAVCAKCGTQFTVKFKG